MPSHEFLNLLPAPVFYNEYNAQFGPCFGYPITCSADLVTGKLTIKGECGCKLTSGWVEVEYCIPPTPSPAPVITGVFPSSFHSGDIIQIVGQGFGNNPDNLCVTIVNSKRLIPLRAVSATSSNLSVEAALSDDLEGTRIKGQFQPGAPMPSVSIKGVSIKGESKVRFSEKSGSAQTDDQAALDQQRVPRAYQNSVRDYFDDRK